MNNRKYSLTNVLFIIMSTIILIGFVITIAIRLRWPEIQPSLTFLATIIGDTIAAALGIIYLNKKNKSFNELRNDINHKWIIYEYVAIGLIILNIILSLSLLAWLNINESLKTAIIVSLIFVVLFNIAATGVHEFANFKINIDIAKKEIEEEKKAKEEPKKEKDSKLLNKSKKKYDSKKDSDEPPFSSSWATAGKFYA